jgi:hypothetical protein
MIDSGPGLDRLSLPACDWSGLSPLELEEAWHELAAWVERLRHAYQPWVQLPDCWPLHEPLRSELLYFMSWQKRALTGEDPEDGVRWHSEIRRSAESWARLAFCDHESFIESPAPVQSQATSRYLCQAVIAWPSRSL